MAKQINVIYRATMYEALEYKTTLEVPEDATEEEIQEIIDKNEPEDGGCYDVIENGGDWSFEGGYRE